MVFVRRFPDCEVVGFQHGLRWWGLALLSEGRPAADVWVFTEAVVVTPVPWKGALRRLRDVDSADLTPDAISAVYRPAIRLDASRVQSVELRSGKRRDSHKYRVDFVMAKPPTRTLWFPGSMGADVARLFRKIYGPNLTDSRGRTQ